MASIENRSRIQVTVKNRDDLTKTFAYNAEETIQRHAQELRSQGLKPRLTAWTTTTSRAQRGAQEPGADSARRSRGPWKSSNAWKVSIVRAYSSITPAYAKPPSPTCWFAIVARSLHGTKASRNKPTKSTPGWWILDFPDKTSSRYLPHTPRSRA